MNIIVNKDLIYRYSVRSSRQEGFKLFRELLQSGRSTGRLKSARRLSAFQPFR